jgi:uncharacterized protein YaaN involved in tellurite resistance
MVGLGDTKKKLQKMMDSAEKTYKKINEVRDDVEDVREKVDRTNERVETMDRELAEQRALLEAVAAENDLDVEELIAEVASEAEPTDSDQHESGDEAASSADS